MQVFVKKADLASTDIPVVAIFEDGPWQDRNLMGNACTVLALPPSAVVRVDGLMGISRNQLDNNWRSNAAMILNMEAQRRILESFSEFMQRNATNALNDALIQYGTDTAAWPQEAKDNKSASDAGWAYVAAVREASDAMQAAMPTDPTADGNWPPRIAPVYIAG
jgi:hypothetical protein